MGGVGWSTIMRSVIIGGGRERGCNDCRYNTMVRGVVCGVDC